jgi:hypothetical protein
VIDDASQEGADRRGFGEEAGSKFLPNRSGMSRNRTSAVLGSFVDESTPKR